GSGEESADSVPEITPEASPEMTPMPEETPAPTETPVPADTTSTDETVPTETPVPSEEPEKDKEKEDSSGEDKKDSKKDRDKKKKDKNKGENEEEEEEEDDDHGAADIARWLSHPSSAKYRTMADILSSFREIERNILFAKEKFPILEEAREDAREVGKVKKGTVLFLIRDADTDGWLYVESGNVRGFIKSDNVYRDGPAEKIAVKVLERRGLSSNNAVSEKSVSAEA
ncbi:MAG: hypothetical protein HUJ73_06265, partial [Eubacterium sp.]|nr:hypothetical protein [Eubacterium sp.]